MFLIDLFKHVTGETVFRELCNIIRMYNLRFENYKCDGGHIKKFYLPRFGNKDWFIKFTYGPYHDTFVPVEMRVCTNCSCELDSVNGVTCSTGDLVILLYNERDISLLWWKHVKKKLLKALSKAITEREEIESTYQAWISEDIDTTLIRFEPIRGRMDK